MNAQGVFPSDPLRRPRVEKDGVKPVVMGLVSLSVVAPMKQAMIGQVVEGLVSLANAKGKNTKDRFISLEGLIAKRDQVKGAFESFVGRQMHQRNNSQILA